MTSSQASLVSFLKRPVAVDGGVVDQDVDGAEVALDLVAHRLDLRLQGHVVGVVIGLAAEVADGVADFLGGRAAGIATDGDIGPGVGQGQGHGPADAPRTAGDERLLAQQAEVGNLVEVGDFGVVRA